MSRIILTGVALCFTYGVTSSLHTVGRISYSMWHLRSIILWHPPELRKQCSLQDRKNHFGGLHCNLVVRVRYHGHWISHCDVPGGLPAWPFQHHQIELQCSLILANTLLAQYSHYWLFKRPH